MLLGFAVAQQRVVQPPNDVFEPSAPVLCFLAWEHFLRFCGTAGEVTLPKVATPVQYSTVVQSVLVLFVGCHRRVSNEVGRYGTNPYQPSPTLFNPPSFLFGLRGCPMEMLSEDLRAPNSTKLGFDWHISSIGDFFNHQITKMLSDDASRASTPLSDVPDDLTDDDSSDTERSTASTSQSIGDSPRKHKKPLRERDHRLWAYSRSPIVGVEPVPEKVRRIFYCSIPECDQYSV